MPVSLPSGMIEPHRPPIRVAVDLSNLRPGGENGGIKPFLFETLLWLGRQQETPLQFLYLTCAQTHLEVRDELARVEDELICVRADGPWPVGGRCPPRERVALPPSPDLLWQLDAQILYCPFGNAEFATPGIGTICTIVDVLHRDFPWTLRPFENDQREQMFQQIVLAADRLQCISHHVASRMRDLYGFPAERMFTSYIAIHQRFGVGAPPAKTSASNAVDASPKPFFFFPANAWKHKNHETLLLAYGIYRAHARAAGETPWPLVLTGHEDERWNELRAVAKALDLLEPGAVSFLGYVPASELGQLWNTAGALVFPSLHEGFGIPLLEAMQHDLPVLTCREGSLLEVGADACLYADGRRPESLALAMSELAADPALRARLVQRGRQRRRDFSLARESGHLLDAVRDLAQRPVPYQPRSRGIFPDGWTEQFATLALPACPGEKVLPGRLTLRFHALPVARRLRLRAGPSVALGTFTLPPFQPDLEISLDVPASTGALRLEVPDALNLDPADAREHGVHVRSIDLRCADGRGYSLFPH